MTAADLGAFDPVAWEALFAGKGRPRKSRAEYMRGYRRGIRKSKK